MNNISNNITFDTFAVLSVIFKESGQSLVEGYLQKASRFEIEIFLNEINLGEIYYRIWKHHAKNNANGALKLIQLWPLTLVSIDQQFILAAATWKAQYKISYADAFCIETAHRHRCPVLTGDPEFSPIKGIKIIKLPQS